MRNKQKNLTIAGTMDEVRSTDNKKGSWRTFRPIVFPEKCTGCRLCALACPDNVIEIVNEKKLAVIDYDYCSGCLICLKECPFNAIEKEEEIK